MSGERLLDDIARALAQPTSRRRILRLLGASLVAVSVPGVRPRVGRAAPRRSRANPCGPDGKFCIENLPNREFRDYCCGAPAWLWECGKPGYPNAGGCYYNCPRSSDYVCQSPTRNAYGFTTGECCTSPLHAGCNADGTCRLNCKHLYKGKFAQCEDTCCPPTHECRNGKCVPKRCPGGGVPCGRNHCCARRERCADPRTRRCSRCAPREEACGRRCCPRGTYCCNEKQGKCCSDRNGSCCGDNPICCEGTDCCKQPDGRGKCCKRGETCGWRGTTAGLVVAGSPRICCEDDRVVAFNAGPVCCPPGYRSLGTTRGLVPVGFCCPDERTCGSGGSITCCRQDRVLGIDQVCRGGRCVPR